MRFAQRIGADEGNGIVGGTLEVGRLNVEKLLLVVLGVFHDSDLNKFLSRSTVFHGIHLSISFLLLV